MSIQSNFPNLQPSLLLDFANTKQLDNRVTFTRSTPAVYYDGKTTAMAEQNLVLQSQTFDVSPWTNAQISVTANATTAPDGTTTADKLVENNVNTTHAVYQFIGTTSGSCTFSVYAKADTRSWLNLTAYVAGPKHNWFDLTNGVTGTVASGCTATITSVGNGWYRCTVTTTGGSPTYFECWLATGNNVTTYAGDGTSGLYLWGAQFEARSSATAYTATTTQPITNYIPVLLTAGGNQPRFDCNPTTGESLGLLIEEQRTNLVSYSSQFNDSYWAKVNSLITENANVAPDGTLSADLATGTSGTEEIFTFVSKSSSAITYTISVYAKNYKDVTTSFSIYLSDNITGQATGVYNFSTVSASATNGSWSNSSATITSVGNGWFRCTLTATSPANSGLLIGFTWGSNSGQAVFLWGAQLEAASFATSYIATTSASATRTADLASMTGTNFSSWYSQGEGTMYGELSSALTTGFRLLTFSDGTSNNQNWISENSAAIYRNNDYQYYASGFNLGNNGKIAMTYAPNDAQNAVNGTYGSVDGTVNLANNLTTALIGANASLDVGSLTIKKLAFYPQRLSQTNLQALTS